MCECVCERESEFNNEYIKVADTVFPLSWGVLMTRNSCSTN